MEYMTINLTRPMNKVVSFMRGLRTKQNPVYSSLVMMMGGNPQWTKKDIARLTEAGYQNCATVYACVNERAGGAAGVPWQLFQRPISKDGKKERIDEHPLLDRMRRPNPKEGGSFFFKKTLAFYHISGNSYLTKVGPEVGPPRELYAIRPDRMKILPGNAVEPIRGYRYNVGGQNLDFKAEQILHLKAFHPLDDWYGLSPIEVACKEIDISAMGREWNMKLLQNDARPSGALISEKTMQDDQWKRLKEQINETHQGYKNTGNPLLLEGGLKWESFAITPKDMDWLNSDKMNSRKICSIYNVPPEIIGDSDNKTYSNYQEARKALYVEAILPDLDFLRDELNNWLAPAFGDRLSLEYDKDAIEVLREEQSAIYTRMGMAHWLTINEKRVACGEDELGPEGDVIMIPANLIPLGDISGNIEEE